MFLISASKACRIISRSVCIRARSSSKDRPCLCNDISFSLECGDRLDYVLVYASDSSLTDINQRTRLARLSTSPSQFPYQANWALSPSSLHTYILRPPCPLDRSFNTRNLSDECAVWPPSCNSRSSCESTPSRPRLWIELCSRVLSVSSSWFVDWSPSSSFSEASALRLCCFRSSSRSPRACCALCWCCSLSSASPSVPFFRPLAHSSTSACVLCPSAASALRLCCFLSSSSSSRACQQTRSHDDHLFYNRHRVLLSNPCLWGRVQSTETISHATSTLTVSAVRVML